MNKIAQAVRRRDQQQSPEAVGRAAGILENRWLIAAVFILVAALGIIRALTAIPVYEASTVILLKHNVAGTADYRPEDNVRTEIEVLKSGSILAPVVDRLRLGITLDPAPPTIAEVVRGKLDSEQPAAGGPGSRPEAHMVRFDTPAALLSLPFKLTLTANDGFYLANDELGIRFRGIAGTPAQIASPYGTLYIHIGKNAAESGTQFILRRVSAAQAMEQLQRALVVTENAKQSNVIKLTLQGADRQLMSHILSEIVAEYTRQRRAVQQSEVSELAASYDRQIAASDAEVRKVDNRYARLLAHSGIGDPEAEGHLLLQQSSALETQLATARQRKAELSPTIGDGHPAMEALNRQIADTVRLLNRNAGKYESLSTATRELGQVQRDKQALEETKLALLNQRSKLAAVIAAEHSDIKIIEQPEASLREVSLGKSTMLILSCFGGIAAGLFASFLKNVIVQHRQARLSMQSGTRFRLISLGRAG